MQVNWQIIKQQFEQLTHFKYYIQYKLIMIQQFSRLALTSQDYLLSQINDSQFPSQIRDSPDIERLDCLHVQNFKSFDKKYVGPFLNFTCIIGPNGSGKSNILDALMFCFCSQSSRHSLLDARQLINRQGKQSFKELSKLQKICSVEATFILKNNEKFVINRTLDGQGKQQFSVNYTIVNKKLYQNILLRKGINSNSPNYAIWQGEIDRLILKDPIQLTNLLQNLSGSIYFKKPYEQTREKLRQIQTFIEEKTRKINKFKIDRKNLKNIKQTNQQYSKYDRQYQQMIKKIYYLQILQKERAIDDLRQQLKNASEEQKKKVMQINQIKANAQKDLAQKNQLQSQMDSLMASLAQHYAKLKAIGNPANIIKIQNLKQTEGEIRNKIEQADCIKQRIIRLKNNMPEIPSSSLMQEYLSIYQEWQSENSSIHRQLTKKKNQLLYIQGLIQSKSQLFNEFEKKKQNYHIKKQQRKRSIQDLKKDIQVLRQSAKKMQLQSSQISQQFERGKRDLTKKNQSYEELCGSIGQLQHLISEQAQDQREGEMLKLLSSIDGFYGALHQKIKPNASKYDVCFSVIFGSISKYLLCQSQQCAKKIGNKLRQIRLMKNVIILDNVHDKKNNDIRKALGRDGLMAIDIVELDSNTKGLKQYVGQFLYGKVVCDTLQNAFKIRNRNIDGVKEIYTYDGNIIRRDGTISSHGNPDSIKKVFKFSNNKSNIYQELSKLNKQKLTLQAEIKSINLRYDDKQLMKRSMEIAEMNRKIQASLSKLQQMEGYNQKQPTLPQSVVSQCNQLEKRKIKIQKVLIELEKSVGSSKIFNKFIQKHKIDNLQGFRNANNFQHIQSLMKKSHEANKQIVVLQATLQKLETQIQRKEKYLKVQQLQIQNIPQIGDKSRIEKQIKQLQKSIVQIRGKLSKLTNISKTQMSFQSVLPSLQAKMNYFKQRVAKDLQDFCYQLGIQYEYPVQYEVILQKLRLPKKFTDKQLENLRQKLDEEKNKIEEQLDKHNSINLLMNIDNDQQKIQKGMDYTIDQIEQLIKQRKKLTQQLQSIRKDRATLLTNFVHILKGHLNQSYGLLTEQQDGGYRGTINLHLQNQEEPFQHGIYFTPTPPTKRFVYDLEQLSGGQKSIASLAFQYSLSLASRSPILILDETDAFLDYGNVSRFLKLINNSLRNSTIQMMIITHKQGLFSKSESLVGVSRPKYLNLSQVYSLRLSQN